MSVLFFILCHDGSNIAHKAVQYFRTLVLLTDGKKMIVSLPVDLDAVGIVAVKCLIDKRLVVFAYYLL